jgi:outer membrane protein assembly factor BamA
MPAMNLLLTFENISQSKGFKLYLRRKITYCLLFMISAYCVQAQDAFSLELSYSDTVSLGKKYKLPSSFKSRDEMKTDLSILILKLQKDGYVTASLDSLVCDSSECKAFVFIGNSYILEQLSNGNINQDAWDQLNLSKLGNKLQIGIIPKLEKRVLSYYENHGHPYAQIWLDSISIHEYAFQASVYVEKNDLILVDTVIVHGNTKTTSKFIEHYIGIRAGEAYNQEKLNRISEKLKQLSYLQESKPTELYFTPGKVSVHVFLEKQKSNQFNLVLGILPNNGLDENKLTITGDGKLQLFNSFGVGEEIFAEFRQLKPRTQNLDISFAYPYFLNTPLGVYGSFNLYKNDSLFLDINTELGLLYQFGGFNRIKFFYKNQTSNILNADTASIKSNGFLPTTLDFRSNTYGLALELQKLDYVLNPRSGYNLILSGGAGLNKIRVNQSIATLQDFKGELLQNQYDSIDLRKVNYSLGLEISKFYPIKKRSTILLQNKSRANIAQNILNNEKFRIGGYRLLRGFDEEAIFTPYYSIFTTEFRFLLSKNSYFSLFADVAIVENEIRGAGFVDVPVGFGTGIALETKGGIFNLSYALGKNLDNKIEFRNGKIHFGYISLF